MRIQTYQIHNVLNVYKKQLAQGFFKEGQAGSGASSGKENKRVVIEKVAANVIEKITRMTTADESVASVSSPKAVSAANKQGYENIFIFNTITDNNQKEIRSISMDDAQMLINRSGVLSKTEVSGNIMGQKI